MEFPGTVMLSRTIEVQAAVAAGISAYLVTWQESTVGVGVVTTDVEGDWATSPDDTCADDAVMTGAGVIVLLITGVG